MSAAVPPKTLAHVGTCAILGLPNVGKSTLLNQLLGVRLMAVSNKPQTTRNRVVGVLNAESEDGAAQIVFVDTPGIQRGNSGLRRYMRDQALGAASECDVALLLVDASDRKQETPDQLFQSEVAALGDAVRAPATPLILAINKVDRVRPKERLLPMLEAYGAGDHFRALVPISALKGSGLDRLVAEIASQLPPGRALFPEDMLTDRAERFFAAELIREQLVRQLGAELPYATAVVIEAFQERRAKGDVAISAVIHVERETQKAIVIGKGGQRIKEIGAKAREAISQLLGCPVHVKLFVRVTADWSNRDANLREMGYE